MNPTTPIKLAIADDNVVFKGVIEKMLKDEPDIDLIIKADNGADLLELIKDNQPDVILLDLRMPVMDGFSTLPRLRRLYPLIKVIILTTGVEPAEVAKALNKGAKGYLLKTASSFVIAEKIRNC